MGAKSSTASLCSVNGRYRRTVGKFVNEKGKVAPKKFLLGIDRKKAEIANLRLEQLWRDVVEATKKENDRRRHEWEQWRRSGVEILPI